VNQFTPPLANKPRTSNVWSAFKKLLLLGLTTLFCVVLLECAVRITLPSYDPRKQLGFVMQPDGFALGRPTQTVRHATAKGDFDLLVHFNQDGFRDGKRLQDSNEDDWIAVGDSFTMGWGIREEQRFSNLLEGEFKARGMPRRCFNVAIPDNIVGYQRLLRYAESRGAKARHLLIGVCMENDLRDYSNEKSDWDATASPHRDIKSALRLWLLRHSALCIVASLQLQKLPFTRSLLEKTGMVRGVEQFMGKNEWNEKALATSRDELLKLAAGRDAVVLIIPSRLLWCGDNRNIEQRIHGHFIKITQEAGLKIVDLRPALEKGGRPLNYYFLGDPHWNARGHAVAARELSKAIRPAGREESGNWTGAF
jgi:hypothetical protein